jgi:uncharacterized OsmC-like protein
MVKWAATANGEGVDAIHFVVEVGKGFGVSQRLGVDAAVGGDHDLPNPGDLLCAALAACADSTVRMVADARRADPRLARRGARARWTCAVAWQRAAT